MFYPNPREGVDVNVRGFLNIMEVVRERDIPVVYASTSSLYSRCQPPHMEDMVVRPGSFHAYSFYAKEGIASLYAELYGVRSVRLRHFSVYGPEEGHKGRFANNVSQFIWEMVKGKSPLTLSTTKVRRFLHTVPSTLGGTSVSAFTSSRLMDYLQGLCHQPVNGLHKRHYLLGRPYIHVYVPSARTTPHLSRPGALFRLSDIQATSKELMED
jgi:hypothetical protein